MGNLRALMKNPRYTLMRGVARFSAVRAGVTGLKSMWSRAATRNVERSLSARLGESLFAGIDPQALLAEIRARGCGFGLELPPQHAETIRRYAAENAVFAFREENKGFMPAERNEAERILGKEIMLAQYFNCEHDCEVIRRLAADPLLNWVALNYLGSAPKFLGCNLWWTYPIHPNREDQVKHAHFFHRDIDDFRFLKFFFYLTGVGSGDGAHWVIAGSHRKAPHIAFKDYFITRRFEDREIAAFYAPANILEVVGNAGTGFAEDTLCVHKAASPTRTPRLILQLQFALFDLGVGNDTRDPAALRMVDGTPLPSTAV